MWAIIAAITLSALTQGGNGAPDTKDFRITIHRERASTSCVAGSLLVNGESVGRSLELPWKQNAKQVSCIPPGEYKAILRYDKSDHWRLQLMDVPGNRTAIQIHVGNYTSDSEGCILVGAELGPDGCSIAAGKSAPTYAELRRRFYGTESPASTPDKDIKVRVESPIEGTWRSTDKEQRWRLSIRGTQLHWIETSSKGVEYPVDVQVDSMSTQFRIERPNDDAALIFLGFSDAMRREIIKRGPKPSYMVVVVKNGTIACAWSGLSATKDSTGAFKELRQPGDTPPKDYILERKD